MKTNLKFKDLFLFAALGTSLTVVSTSCGKDDPVPTPTPTPTVDGTLSDVAKSYTVFAPTNSAFRALNIGLNDAAAVGTLSQGQVDTFLTPILLYHVLGSKVLAKDVPTDAVATLNTKNVFTSNNTNGVFVNGIKVSKADLVGSNGVVHVIGKVLIPPAKSITEIVVDNPNFSRLKQTVIKADLATTLGGPGKFTVFAPDNAAFATSGIDSAAIAGFDKTFAAGVITQHAFGTNIFASDLVAGETAFTLNPSKKLTVALSPAVTVIISGSTKAPSAVTATDIVATNGVIHIIDRVLL
jgi:uncharacterized surface protein with fasciclin (FAS1) repeats